MLLTTSLRRTFSAACALGLLVAGFGARGQELKVNPETGETQAQFAARTAWWREAKFGMFIHWGVYAVPADSSGHY